MLFAVLLGLCGFVHGQESFESCKVSNDGEQKGVLMYQILPYKLVAAATVAAEGDVPAHELYMYKRGNTKGKIHGPSYVGSDDADLADIIGYENPYAWGEDDRDVKTHIEQVKENPYMRGGADDFDLESAYELNTNITPEQLPELLTVRVYKSADLSAEQQKKLDTLPEYVSGVQYRVIKNADKVAVLAYPFAARGSIRVFTGDFFLQVPSCGHPNYLKRAAQSAL